MKRILRIIFICVLMVVTSFAVACQKSCNTTNPWNPPTNDFGDDKDGNIGTGKGEQPEPGGTIIKSFIIVE